MNILMALSQKEITGAEVYAVTLAKELMARGHKVFIVSDTLTCKSDAPFYPLPFNERKLLQRPSHIKKLIKIIKDNDIQIVHANSRASSWSCAVACKLCNIPLITTTHGRQPVHLSRKIIKGFGQRSICVCENIQTQICNELGFDKAKTILLRNPVDPKAFSFKAPRFADDASASSADASTSAADSVKFSKDNPINVALVGRFSGPKGDVAYEVLKRLSPCEHIHIRVIGGGNEIPERFVPFSKLSNVEFLGYCSNVPSLMQEADVVVGAGRVGIEAVLVGRPMIAIGEALYEGLVNEKTLPKVLASNFGDINYVNETHFEYERLVYDVEAAVKLKVDELKLLRERMLEEYELNTIVDKVERLYSQTYVEYKRYEVPVIMYHRVIADMSEAGIHGTYVTKELFTKHLQTLKDKGYQTTTFKELAQDHNLIKRFDNGKKLCILTFDDGYEDNHRVMFPIIKEFGYKAVIFLLSNRTYNSWDADNKDNPEKRLELMSDEQIKEMAEYGIEFGAHSETHPRLADIPLDKAREEIFECKKKLEERYGMPFITFAYPYGSQNEEVKKLAKEAGFTYAVATDSGPIMLDHDLYQIRRIGIFPRNSMFTFKRKISGYYNFIKVRREQRAAAKHNNK